MNKQLELCDFKLSKLLKEVGFDWECKPLYTEDRKLHPYMAHWLCNYKEFIPAPELSLAAKWFREVHNIEISNIYGTLCNKWMYGIYFMDVNNKYFEADMIYESYEQALSEGLKEAIKLIKNNYERK